MTVIHAKTALLPGGWAQDVRVTLAQGRIAAVETGVPGVGVDCLLPAMANLHSHMFQRAMAGMTEAVSYTHLDVYKRQVLLDPRARAARCAHRGRSCGGGVLCRGLGGGDRAWHRGLSLIHI